ncbi:MAG TPA: hypothetical protein VIE65_09465, partial [Methylobacter sp.]
MPAAQILKSLENPVPSVLGFLEQLERQVNLQTFQPGDGDDGFGTSFGTLTASRRNSKPFIIGFLPPDNVVDFIPVINATSPVGLVPTSVNPPQAVTGIKVGTKNYGELPKTRVTVSVSDVRQAIYNSYLRQTGVPPTENTLGLMASQILVENGGNAAATSFGTNNYNLGNSHASGGGTYAPGQDTKASRSANSRNGVLDPPPTPSGGTYYFGTDYDGSGKAYPVYFAAYKSLDDAVDHHVNQLLTNWNGAANAQDVQGFISGLQHDPSHGAYFQISESVYASALNNQLLAYRARFGNDPIGSNPTDAKNLSADDGTGRQIMTSGSFGGVESQDPLANRFGRNIRQADEARIDSAQKQTSALKRQIDAIHATSPLLLLINPSEFARSYEASIDNGIKGRYKNIVHTWLERPGIISSNGVTAGQYIVDAEGSGGLTNTYRIHTVSYQNLLSLVLTYKNNGILFAGSESDRGIPILACSLYIYYDQILYIGSFDDLSVSDSADRPYNMSYSFKFSVRYMFEFDAPFVDSTI